MLTPSRTAGRSCYDIGVTQVCRDGLDDVYFDLESRPLYALQRVSPIGWPKPAHLAKPSADDWTGSHLLTATSEYKEKFG